MVKESHMDTDPVFIVTLSPRHYVTEYRPYKTELYSVFWGFIDLLQFHQFRETRAGYHGLYSECEMWNRLIKIAEDRMNKKVFM